MNQSQITTMLQLQDRLNCVVNPNWLTANYPWPRAIWTEAAEMMEHIGWKWWKDSKPADKEQLRLELVDIWHFAISHILQIHEGDVHAASIEITRYFSNLQEDPDVYGDISKAPVHTLIDLIAGSAAIQHQLNGPAFNMLMKEFDLTWDSLYTIYVGKNVLNLFRQANGYKEGTYVKIWGDEEDNVVLARIMSEMPGATPDMLMSELQVRYDQR